DAKAIQDRLDQVAGVDGWMDHYQVLADGSVMCKLGISSGGSPRSTSAARASSRTAATEPKPLSATHCEVRHRPLFVPSAERLGRLRSEETPELPPWAMPGQDIAKRRQPVEQHGQPNAMPKDGSELERRLADYDARLAAEGLIMAGDLLSHVSK